MFVESFSGCLSCFIDILDLISSLLLPVASHGYNNRCVYILVLKSCITLTLNFENINSLKKYNENIEEIYNFYIK